MYYDVGGIWVQDQVGFVLFIDSGYRGIEKMDPSCLFNLQMFPQNQGLVFQKAKLHVRYIVILLCEVQSYQSVDCRTVLIKTVWDLACCHTYVNRLASLADYDVDGIFGCTVESF